MKPKRYKHFQKGSKFTNSLLTRIGVGRSELRNPQNYNPRFQPYDSSLGKESIAQGLPPVQVGLSVDHLHEGYLGEVH